MSRYILVSLQFCTVLLLAMIITVQGQQTQTGSTSEMRAAIPVDWPEPPPAPTSGNRVIDQFVKAEKLVRDSMNQHTFKRDVLLQTIGPNGEVNGDYIRKSQFIFDDRGNRIERVLYHPAPSLQKLKITKEDIQDLAGAQLLGIDVTEQSKYRLAFVGAEILGNRSVFAIDITPHVKPNPYKMRERSFVGRIWIDAKTFQIVKVRGKVEPQGKQRFPTFETWRETPQGDVLFPTRTHADDILRFPEFDVHYRVQVKYYDYKLFAGKVTVKDIDPDAEISESLHTPAVSAEASERPITCKTKKSAPPVSLYVWPPDTTVQVYFMRGLFTSEQRQTLVAAMKDWNHGVQKIGAGVSFQDAGETDRRVSCKQCLTIARKNPQVKDNHFYATFYPVDYERNGWLNFAWIEFSPATTDPKALQGYMAHELGHTLGLDNCPSCGDRKSIMNSFPAVNRHNGLLSPSHCDLEVVRKIYDGHRKLAGASSQTPSIGK